MTRNVIGLFIILFGIAAALADPAVAAFVASPAGLLCGASAVLLDAVGALWMRHMIGRVA